MRKILKISMVVIVVIIIFLGLLWSTGRFETVDRVSCVYYARISSDGVGNYTIYLPIAIETNGTISEVMRRLQIREGNAQWEIMDTNYGRALKVVGNTTVVLTASVMFDISEKIWRPNANLQDSKEQFPRDCPGLSMWNNTTTTYKSIGSVWLYCSMSPEGGNITVDLSLDNVHISRRPFRPTIIDGFVTGVEEKISAGWQLLDIERGGSYS